MKQFFLLFILFLGLKVQADLIRLNLPIDDYCSTENTDLTIKTNPSVPDEVHFLTQNSDTYLIPKTIEVTTKNDFNTAGAENNAVRIATDKGQFFTLYSLFNTEIYIQAKKELLCDPSTEVSFTYELRNRRDQSFGMIKYQLTNKPGLTVMTPNSRQHIMKLINYYYLDKLIYLLSEDFSWFKDSNDLFLVNFFSTLDPEYLLNKKDIETVLTNPRYSAVVLDKSLNISFGDRILEVKFTHDYYTTYLTAGKSNILVFKTQEQ